MTVEKIEDETGVKFVLSADRHQIVNAIRLAIENFETNADSLESVLRVRSDYSAERILAKLRADGFTYPEFDGEPAKTVEDAMNQWIDGQTTIHLGIERAGWVPCAGIEIRQDGDGWAVSVRRWPDTPAICLPGVNTLIRGLETELEKLAPETRQETDGLPTAEEKTKTGARAGTLGRVREAHRLLRTAQMEGKSRNWAFRKAGTDSRTYYQWCEQATGESPLLE